MLEVYYHPGSSTVEVWTYTSGQSWVQQRSDISVSFANGDILGARALSDGTVTVYKNGNLIATRDVSSWPYYDDGGYIGLWTMSGNGTYYDDFGGGTLASSGPTPTPTQTPVLPSFPQTGIQDDFNRSNGSIGSNWGGDTTGYQIASNKLDVGTGGEILWQGSAYDADQEAYVTFTTVDTDADEMDLLLKSQSSSGTGSGTLEVWYDPVSDYVSVWSYESSQGWVRYGAFIPAVFDDGDVLGARATADGMVYVFKNSVLLGGRDVTAWPYYDNGGYIGLWFLNAGDAVADDFGGGDLTESRAGGSEPPPLAERRVRAAPGRCPGFGSPGEGCIR